MEKSALSIWDETSEEARQEICRRLGWPLQYADGDSSDEWLTENQRQALRKLKVTVFWNEENGEFELE